MSRHVDYDGYSRRQVLRWAMAGAAVTPLAPLIAACSTATTTTGASGSAASGTLIVGVPATPPGWDQETDSGLVINDMLNAINGRLFDFKFKPNQGGGVVPDLSGPSALVPSLATGYEAQGDSVVIHLRHGVKSHAGNELTADDVVWTFGDRAFGLNAVGAFLNSVSGIASLQSIKKVDDFTVQFILDQPNDIFLLSLAIAFRSVYDSTEFKKHATKSDPFATNWAATGDGGFGPFKIGIVEMGNQIVLNRFGGYWNSKNIGSGGNPALINSLVLKEVPSPDDRVALVSRGSIDVAYELSALELQSLKGHSSTRVWNFPSTNIAIYMLDPNFPPLDNQKVRQALAYAAPYEALVNDVLLKTGTRAGGPVPSLFPGYATYFQRYSTNLQKAKALLAQAGFASGFTTQIAYDSTDPTEEQMSILFQSNLAQIGIKASLVGLTDANYVASQHSTETKDKYPIVAYIDGPLVPDPYYALYLNFDSQSPLNWSQVSVPGIDSILANMKDVQSFAHREALGNQAQELIAEEVPWIFLAEPGIQVATTSAIKEVGASVGYLAWEELGK
jgi:peptide/nickel transport system substrate-binding protein